MLSSHSRLKGVPGAQHKYLALGHLALRQGKASVSGEYNAAEVSRSGNARLKSWAEGIRGVPPLPSLFLTPPPQHLAESWAQWSRILETQHTCSL